MKTKEIVKKVKKFVAPEPVVVVEDAELKTLSKKERMAKRKGFAK